MKRAALLLGLLLAGCQTPPPKVVTVQVPVREPCIAKAPERPAYRFARGSMPGDGAQAALLIADFEAAERYATAWEVAAVGCIKP